MKTIIHHKFSNNMHRQYRSTKARNSLALGWGKSGQSFIDKIIRNIIILPNKITQQIPECACIIWKCKNWAFQGRKTNHILDLQLSIQSPFASQSFKQDYRIQRKNYFWEVGNTHKYSAECLKLRLARFSKVGIASR